MNKIDPKNITHRELCDISNDDFENMTLAQLKQLVMDFAKELTFVKKELEVTKASQTPEGQRAQTTLAAALKAYDQGARQRIYPRRNTPPPRSTVLQDKGNKCLQKLYASCLDLPKESIDEFGDLLDELNDIICSYEDKLDEVGLEVQELTRKHAEIVSQQDEPNKA